MGRDGERERKPVEALTGRREKRETHLENPHAVLGRRGGVALAVADLALNVGAAGGRGRAARPGQLGDLEGSDKGDEDAHVERVRAAVGDAEAGEAR